MNRPQQMSPDVCAVCDGGKGWDAVSLENAATYWLMCHACGGTGKSPYALLVKKQSDQRDAERYQWLRSEEVATDPMYFPFWAEFQYKLTRLERMDALIDKWMEGVPEPESENELLRDDGALGVGA